MNTRVQYLLSSLTVATALVLSGCGPRMIRPEGAEDARARLTRLQSDPELASRAPVEIRDAERAVRAAEEPRRQDEMARHLVIIADRKVDIAWSFAEARRLEDERKQLSAEREQVRLDARTREADKARRDAEYARTAAQIAQSEADAERQERQNAQQQADAARLEQQRAAQDAEAARTQAVVAQTERERAALDADAARAQAAAAQTESARATLEANAARQQAALAKQQADELRQQVDELNARETERGLVVTLGDVLFETAKADLKGGSANNLGKLAAFLVKYPDRGIVIEGHTDNVGNDDYNLGLSQRRAESVRSFLVAQGVAANRISASGKGESSPVSSNDTSTGRQQNRRVEVIIANPSA
jgi:outer membrane protein OmpA-like peptidoglycan-associated protein